MNRKDETIRWWKIGKLVDNFRHFWTGQKCTYKNELKFLCIYFENEYKGNTHYGIVKPEIWIFIYFYNFTLFLNFIAMVIFGI